MSDNITGWRVIGVSGKTADGRDIPEKWLSDAADQYDPVNTYGARINIEHIKFMFPDADMNGLGDVVALKAERRDDGKLALLAKLRVNQNLQKLWDAGQKIYSSMEIMDKFADTGRAYLTGLAVTDTPSSLGTTANFSLASVRAGAKSTHVSEYTEMSTMPQAQTTDTANDAAVDGLFAKFLAKFSKTEAFTTAQETAAAEQAAPQEQKDDSGSQNAEITALKAELAAAAQAFALQSAELAVIKAEHAALAAKFNAFVQKVETTPVSGQRQPHAGANDIPQSAY